MYHNISSKFELSFRSVSSNLLKKHLKLLKNKGFNNITKLDLIKGGLFDNKKSVFITFDDAYEGVYYSALPVMEEFGFSAAVFIPAGYIGKFNEWDFTPFSRLRHMDKKMLIDLSKNGWIVGSHGFTHTDLRKCSNGGLRKEICDSKKKIEDIIGEEVFLFAYPFGLYNEKVMDMVKNCGYKYAFATANGITNNRYAVSRMALYFIDASPIPLLSDKYCGLYLFRNRIISSLSALTPIYKKYINHLW